MYGRIGAHQAAEGFVYVMEAGGYHKIGWSKASPRSRLKDIQVGCPLKVTLIGCIEGSRAAEDAWHEVFRDKRVHGEWFQLTEEDIAHVLHESVGIDRLPGDDHIA